ncbi:Alkanesulfonate monooxygenase [archaeon HR01]|nr:Alkanesulfonate monooxygenase [archaeon HR01]
MGAVFGAVVPRYDLGWGEVLALAKDYRDWGFRYLWFTDHLQPSRANTVFETWTVMAAISQHIRDARLGTTVLCYSYRHPAVLAKMVATLDHISGGRVELGLGIGSEPQGEEHEALGIPYQRGVERYEGFKEYVEVIRILLTAEGTASFRGRYYTLRNARANTPPIQKPHPPIWIGARKKRMVKVAAETGFGWNFYGESVEEYREAVKIFEDACRVYGREPHKIPRALFTSVLVFESEDERVERFRPLPKADSVEEVLRRTFTLLYGGPDRILRQVEELESLGVQQFILRDLDNKSSNLRDFAGKVLPSLI